MNVQIEGVHTRIIQVEHSGMYFLTLLFIRKRIKICFKSLYKK